MTPKDAAKQEMFRQKFKRDYGAEEWDEGFIAQGIPPELDLMTDDVFNALAAAGYAVVPVEPTRAMINAGAETMDPCWGYADPSIADDWATSSWKAMIAAAPHYMDDAEQIARKALAPDAGKAAADVLAAVEAVRKLPFQHTGAIGALFDAYDAFRKEGRDDD